VFIVSMPELSQRVVEHINDDSSSDKKSIQIKDMEGLQRRSFVPRFNLARDIPRLFVSIVQIGLSYALMLAVMYVWSPLLFSPVSDSLIGPSTPLM
jgi:hypothetical protein